MRTRPTPRCEMLAVRLQTVLTRIFSALLQLLPLLLLLCAVFVHVPSGSRQGCAHSFWRLVCAIRGSSSEKVDAQWGRRANRVTDGRRLSNEKHLPHSYFVPSLWCLWYWGQSVRPRRSDGPFAFLLLLMVGCCVSSLEQHSLETRPFSPLHPVLELVVLAVLLLC